MSLLLDALRKAEQERTLGQPPTPGAVATGVGAPTTTADTRPSGRFRTIIVLLLLVTLCAVALVLRRAPATPDHASPRLSPPPVLTPRPAPTPPPPPAPAPSLMRLGQLEVRDPPSAPVLPSGEIPAGESAPDDLDTPEAAPDALPDLETLQQPVAPPDPTAPPPSVAPSTAIQASPGAPTLQMLPAEQRARFPAFQLDVHVWNEAPARRFVLIEGHRYSVGDPLPGGLTLREIVPEGVIVEFEGRRVMVARPG